MTSMLLEWIAIGGIGAMIGFAGGLFGVGGGMIAVPVLALGFGLEQQFAQGTTYVMASPTALLGLWHYYRHGSVDRRYAVGLAVAGGIAGYIGTLLAIYLDPQQLRRVFSVFLLLLVSYMVISELPHFAPRSTRKLLDSGHAKGRDIRLETALTGVGIPLHPGAERFYKEKGLAK